MFADITLTFSGLLLLLIQLIIVSAAWIVTYRHNRRRRVPPQNRYWSRFLLFHALFFLILVTLHLSLELRPGMPAELLQSGYIVAHAMMFIALAYLARLAACFTPWLFARERLVFAVFGALALLATILNVLSPPEPVYNASLGLMQFDVATPVSVLIVLLTTATYVPLGYIFLRTAWRQRGRVKRPSYLLGAGLLVLYAAGPVHNYAIGPVAYIAKDGLTMIAFVLIVLGVTARTRGAAGRDARGGGV